ncbi:hypothetical protein FA95DRAFT_79147 [Auriscalpium vulgare]|uniref:Uncharacterized protein n=1 Tax=Auriscalpium vulgare TaxID=40419 RepID=A0ACB8RPT8_9AGAM|nr:hypothetical protein FA95DRAFT_79147 [Auriscalpium vulgare]
MSNAVSSCHRCGKNDSSNRNFMLTCRACRRAWHHRCHIPVIDDRTLIVMINATVAGTVAEGLESWECRRCRKKQAPVVPSTATRITHPARICLSDATTLPSAPSSPLPAPSPSPASNPPIAKNAQDDRSDISSLKRPRPADPSSSPPTVKRPYHPERVPPRDDQSRFSALQSNAHASTSFESHTPREEPIPSTFRPYTRPAHFRDIPLDDDILSPRFHTPPHTHTTDHSNSIVPDTHEHTSHAEDAMDIDTPPPTPPPPLPPSVQFKNGKYIPDVKAMFTKLRDSGRLHVPAPGSGMSVATGSMRSRPPPMHVDEPASLFLSSSSGDDDDDAFKSKNRRAARKTVAPLQRPSPARDEEDDLYTPAPPWLVERLAARGSPAPWPIPTPTPAPDAPRSARMSTRPPPLRPPSRGHAEEEPPPGLPPMELLMLEAEQVVSRREKARSGRDEDEHGVQGAGRRKCKAQKMSKARQLKMVLIIGGL